MPYDTLELLKYFSRVYIVRLANDHETVLINLRIMRNKFL